MASTASSDLSFNSFAGLPDLSFNSFAGLPDLSFNSSAGLPDLSLIDGLVPQQLRVL